MANDITIVGTRRRSLAAIMAALLAGSIAATAGGAAFAKTDGPVDPAKFQQRIEKRVDKALGSTDATTEQKKKVTEILQAAKSRVQSTATENTVAPKPELTSSSACNDQGKKPRSGRSSMRRDSAPFDGELLSPRPDTDRRRCLHPSALSTRRCCMRGRAGCCSESPSSFHCRSSYSGTCRRTRHYQLESVRPSSLPPGR